MKTKIFLAIFALATIFSVNQVLAIETRKAVTSQTKREEKIATKSTDQQEKVKMLYQTIKNGLEGRHKALLNIKDKIQARIDSNPMNKDTSAAKKELIKFTAAEAKYQVDLALLDSNFNKINSNTKTPEAIKSFKDSVSLVRADLNNIKEILTATVTALAKAPKLEITKTE